MSRFIACVLSGVLLSGAAFAQDAVQPKADVQASTDTSSGVEKKAKASAASGPSLTLRAAITMGLAHSPRLKSSEAAQRASKGERRQAGQWINPEVEVGAENFGGRGQFRNFSAAEITYGVSQQLEIGGKRSARIDAAERGMDIAAYDLQAVKLDVIRDVTQAYAEAVAASEEVKLARDQQKLASGMLQAVTRRVDAAREPLIQKSKASVALASSSIALEKAERAQESAKKALANLIGGDAGGLDTKSFYAVKEPAEAAAVSAALDRNPDIARWKPAIARSEAALRLERANAVPDPRLNAGVRDLRDVDGSTVFVAGISIPFPILNRNQGSIERARAEVNKAESDSQAAQLSSDAALTDAAQKERAAYTQAMLLKDTILPEAKKSFALANQGYQAGKFAYLEVLDAQRTLADARLQHVEALKEYHTQRATVERLTAAHLTDSTYEEGHE
jgi:cobalt-zinc-cadmium efflux system outer membrane protein